MSNALIDTQHRMQMLLCRKLEIAIKTAQPEQTISEQNLMHEIGYPQVAEHAQIHNTLLIELQVELSKIRLHNQYQEDLMSRVYAWFNDHVVEDDLKVAEFAKTSPQRPIGEELYQEFLGSPAAVAGD